MYKRKGFTLIELLVVIGGSATPRQAKAQYEQLIEVYKF